MAEVVSTRGAARADGYLRFHRAHLQAGVRAQVLVNGQLQARLRLPLEALSLHGEVVRSGRQRQQLIETF